MQVPDLDGGVHPISGGGKMWKRGDDVELKEFFDTKLLEQIMKEWSLATGMAMIATDAEGNYITGDVGFTDFCIKYTRGSAEGMRRCVKCDTECSGTYFCHAGLMDFSIDIKVKDEIVGKIIGGQILPEEPDEEKFRELAKEFGIDPDTYIEALRKIPIRTEESIRASAKLLGDVVNQLVNFEHMKTKNEKLISLLDNEIKEAVDLIHELNGKSENLAKIESKQKMLSLNASIEAARAGEAGRGFAVVASQVGKLSSDSSEINASISESLHNLTETIEAMAEANDY